MDECRAAQATRELKSHEGAQHHVVPPYLFSWRTVQKPQESYFINPVCAETLLRAF